MLRGLPVSILLHAGIVAAGSIVLPRLGQPLEQEAAIVPIELVTVSEMTNIAPRIERETEEPESEEPPPLEDYLEDLDTVEPPEEDATEEEVLAPEEAPPPPQEAEPEPVPEDDSEEEPPQEPEAEPEPDPEPERETPLIEQEPEDPLAAVLGDASNLFDKTPREPQRAPPQAPEPELEDEQPRRSTERAGAGERTGNTAAVETLITSQLTYCWDDVDDLPNPERLNVTVRIQLNRDGTLKRDAELVRPARMPIGDRPMQVAIERALRATRKCAPYRIPEQALEYYADWSDVTINFGQGMRR